MYHLKRSQTKHHKGSKIRTRKHQGTKNRTRKHKGRRQSKGKRGGGFIQNAMAPLALLGIAQLFTKKNNKTHHKGTLKHKSSRSSSRSRSRSRK